MTVHPTPGTESDPLPHADHDRAEPSSPVWRGPILVTLFVLLLARLGTWIPLPGIDIMRLPDHAHGSLFGVSGIPDMLTGGALYTACVCVVSQLLFWVHPIPAYLTGTSVLILVVAVLGVLERVQPGSRKLGSGTDG